MKQPKKLTYAMKKILSNKGINAREYMLLEEDKETFTVINKQNRFDTMTFEK